MKLIGGILLIVSMSLGAAMLALPVVTAPSGFIPGTCLLFTCWLLMTFSAFLLLEINLWLPENSNIISMARATLGRTGQVIAWICYLLLLYTLISAFISGGSDIVREGLLSAFQVNCPHWATNLIFVGVFFYIVHHGIHFVDQVNRYFMFIKLALYVFLMVMVAPHIQMEHLRLMHPQALLPIMTVAITAYGFSIIVPSLRAYFNSDVKKLRTVILCGSLVPLVCYVLWDLAVLGTLPLEGEHGLLHVLHSGRAATEVAKDLKQILGNPYIAWCVQGFTTLCIVTSFLGVSLSLTDFLADGLKISKRGKEGFIVYLLTFVPPLFIVLVYPHAFIMGLSYAGVLVILLMIMMPTLMAWSGRYCKQFSSGYQVLGGKLGLILAMLSSVAIVAIEFTHLNLP